MSVAIALDETWFQGAASVERTATGLKPWRLPHHLRHLYPSLADGLMDRASFTSGVRLRFETNSPTLRLTFEPLPAPGPVMLAGHCFDVVVNNEIAATVSGSDACAARVT